MLGHLFEEIGSFFAELFEKEETWVILFIAGLLITLPFLNLSILWNYIKALWWLWLFFILLPSIHSLILFWRQELFKRSIEWTLLELNIPREIKKSPQAMEQVLTVLNSMGDPPGNFEEKYKKGMISLWFSLELVSLGGEVHFFVRTPTKLRDVVEAAFFSYYPDVEVSEVEDYISRLPLNFADAEKRDVSFWGTDFVLVKEAAYPIRTYPNFEHITEEKQFDPISTFLELLAKVKKEETLAIQVLIEPATKKWRDAYEDLVKKLRTAEKTAVPAGEGETEKALAPLLRSPGQTDVLKAVELNLSKQAFDTLVRFVYAAPKELYKTGAVHKAILGAFNQYSALNLNSFKSNIGTMTVTEIWSWPHAYPTIRRSYKRERILWNFRRREIPPKTWMGKFITSYFMNWNFASKQFEMTTEGVATIFHPPTWLVVTAPHIKRVESRKAGPPAGMAIFGGEEHIEKYK